ncbi:hypothetical protein SKAU_G00220340 [Synaphobranchus kaupii]|uniref:Uncharacterized protein n=1 Tax=Synaphobranchus kaupii TaxID=118154 RepID=A0A9Q1IUX6_SYNKA|nr:hypothetical protein SKAU_G00220340 [Synaphobranchus kaupii]
MHVFLMQRHPEGQRYPGGERRHHVDNYAATTEFIGAEPSPAGYLNPPLRGSTMGGKEEEKDPSSSSLRLKATLPSSLVCCPST